MLDVNYGALEYDGHLKPLAEQATKLLEKVIGIPARRVSVQWDRMLDDRGRTRATLRLRDGFGGEVGESFDAFELALVPYIRPRLHHLWGDLLQLRSDDLRRRVEELVREGVGG